MSMSGRGGNDVVASVDVTALDPYRFDVDVGVSAIWEAVHDTSFH